MNDIKPFLSLICQTFLTSKPLDFQFRRINHIFKSYFENHYCGNLVIFQRTKWKRWSWNEKKNQENHNFLFIDTILECCCFACYNEFIKEHDLQPVDCNAINCRRGGRYWHEKGRIGRQIPWKFDLELMRSCNFI